MTQPVRINQAVDYSAAFGKVSQLLEGAVQEGVFPGAVLLVGRKGEVLYNCSVGVKATKTIKGVEPTPMKIDTVFDIASLTEVLATTTVIMKLVENSQLNLSDRISRYVQGFSTLGKSTVTVAQLLSHCAGLAHWHPYFEELLKENEGARMGIMTSRVAKHFVFNAINRSQLKHPPGSRQLYSDIGFILLGQLIEVLTGLNLDKAVQKFVVQPLGLKSTSYIDLSLIRRRGIHPVTELIAPTEECPWRKRIIWGEVHDENAWAMGGIAGHSGVFSTAFDLHLFAREMIRAYHGQSSFLKQETVGEFWTQPHGFPSAEVTSEEGWRYGWDTPSKENGLFGSRLSPHAVGMSGFTGCSLWIEPHQGIDIILMSNRIHPTRSNKKIRAFRPQIHDAVLTAIDTL